MMGRDRDRGRGMDSGPDKTDTDWRARPSSDMDDGPRRDDSFGESELIGSSTRLFDLTNVLLLSFGFQDGFQ